MDDQATRELVADIERLVGEIDADPAGPLRDRALEAVSALLCLYGEALTRILSALGPVTAVQLSADELLGHLMMLHGLHPEPLEERVNRALDEVRPYLRSHGGDVELAAIEGSAARVRLKGSCHGCPSSRVTLQGAVEDAVRKAAPELDTVVAEQDGEEPAVRVSLPMFDGCPLPIAGEAR